MKASEFDLGTDVRIQWGGLGRYRVTKKGQGHGYVHRVTQVDTENGTPMPGADERVITSRQIIQTWDQFLLGRPNFYKERQEKAAKEAAHAALKSVVEEAAGETAALLSALGFEARVVPSHGNEGMYIIQIENPTENQEFLREAVAKKWGM